MGRTPSKERSSPRTALQPTLRPSLGLCPSPLCLGTPALCSYTLLHSNQQLSCQLDVASQPVNMREAESLEGPADGTQSRNACFRQSP